LTGALRQQSKTTVGRLIGQVSIYGLGAVITPLVSALLVPIYARVLSTSEFGELAVIEAVQSILMLVVGLRLADSVLRVYYLYESPDDRDAVLNTSLLAGIAVSILFVAVLWGINVVFDVDGLVGIDQRVIYKLMLLILVPGVIRGIVLASLRAQQRAMAYVGVSLTTMLSLITVKVVFVAILRQGVIGSLRGELLGGMIGALISLGVARKGIRSWRLSGSALMHSLRFGLPLMPSGFFAWILRASPRYFLLWNFSDEEVGKFFLALKLPTFLLTFFLEPVRRAWQPLVYGLKNAAEQRQSVAKSLYGIVTLMSIGGLAMSLFAREITILVLSSRHIGVAQYIPPLALWGIVQAALMSLGVAINLKSRTEYISLGFLLGAVVMVGANATLTPSLGVWGAVFAANLAYLSILVAYVISVDRVFPIPVSWMQLAGIVLLGIICFLGSFLLPKLPMWFYYVGKTTILLAFILIVMVSGLLGPLHSRVRIVLKKSWFQSIQGP